MFAESVSEEEEEEEEAAAAVTVSSCSSVQTLPRLSNTCSNNRVSSAFRLDGGLDDAALEDTALLLESEDMNASTGVVGVDTSARQANADPVGVRGLSSRNAAAKRRGGSSSLPITVDLRL